MRKKYLTGMLLAGMAFLTVYSGIQYTKEREIQKAISEKVLRFHVLANSDREEDQQLKYQVRDVIGGYMEEKLADAKDRSESQKIVREHLEEITQLAAQTVAEAGYGYGVEARLEETEFPAKTYGAFTFPPGSYEALRIVIGEGAGHNWWCVLYPNLCFEGSMYEEENDTGRLREVLSEEELSAVLNHGNYKVRCKYLKFLNPYLEKLTE